jgi:transposase
MFFELSERRVVGSTGDLTVPAHDELTPRLLMLLEGQCEGLGPAQAAQKYGLSRQRYYQVLKQFQEKGAPALQNQKRGPKTNYVRTDEVERQVIRHRFLDPDASVDVIAQKLRQAGFAVSTRSVERVIEKYGLQKKTLSLPPGLSANH